MRNLDAVPIKCTVYHMPSNAVRIVAEYEGHEIKRDGCWDGTIHEQARKVRQEVYDVWLVARKLCS